MADKSDLSRRRFLQTGALVAGAAAVGLSPVTAWGKKLPVSRARGLAALAKDFDGRIILPNDQGYAMAAWPNNARYANVRPGAIAMCNSDDDVAFCINWARDGRKTFLIRSGGHNYAGFSTSNSSTSAGLTAPDLLIDVKPMNGVTVDEIEGTVRVQGGASNQDVANVLRAYPYAVPSGRCPTVGTSGLVLGGGWGFAATRSGLTCDSLRGTEMVLADGNKVFTSPAVKNDLFWAVRGGGGGNFGVHTAFYFKLHDVREPVTTFNIVWPAGNQIELMIALQKMQLANATTMSTRTKVRPTEAVARPPLQVLAVETLGLYWGKEKELRDILKAATSLPWKTADIYEMDYWRARDYLLTDDPVGMYDIKCSYVQDTLGEKALQTMLAHMQKWPGGSLRQDNMGILFAIGGKVKEVARDATAYVHRNSNYIFEMECSWAPIDNDLVVDKQRGWLREYYDAMQDFVQPESYVNFPNRDLKNWAQSYYGSNLPRLSEVKCKYDPHEVFKFAQSIPVKVGCL